MIDNKSVQQVLAKYTFYKGPIDGLVGAGTLEAAHKLLEMHFHPDVSWKTWPATRRWFAVQQLVFKHHGIDPGKIDGFKGPSTAYALEQWHAKLRDIPAPPTPSLSKSNVWPRQSQAEMTKFYGKVGTNQETLVTPYPLKLAWDKKTTVNRFSINVKCHQSALRVMKKVLKVYGYDEIVRLRLDLFGGCLNVRPMRGGTAYSTHAWGAAIDWDPDHNQLHWGPDKAAFAKYPYDAWWKEWEAEGWVSLGRARSFDFMHVQAATL